MYAEETIAAISTPPGTGGIGIVRMSGKKAFEIAGRIFAGKKPFGEIRTHSVNYGRIVDPGSGEVIDEVLLSKMRGPHTFTREDIVEINCHGGPTVQRKILELVTREGARPAEPGEFTRRAFLNGRIDLSQAEAVIDLINSKTEAGSKAAVAQLEGRLSAGLKKSRDKLVELAAHIDAVVDYPEHDIEEITGREVCEGLLAVRKKLSDMACGFDKGRIIREGINAVIAGRPNVGKSSLLNEIAGKNRAIVTDIPGTTRDIIEEYVNIHGIPARITDTAGLRETEDAVERLGVEKAQKAMDQADLVLMMLDAGEGVTAEDEKIFERIRGKRVIYILNKIDLDDGSQAAKMEKRFDGVKTVRTSLKEGTGIDRLIDEIAGMFFEGAIDINSELLMTNIRHKNLVDRAVESIDRACEAYKKGMPLDCMAIDITDAVESLGQITGESAGEDIIREIFGRFCVGK